MAFFDKLFRRSDAAQGDRPEEHAVLIYIALSDDEFGTSTQRDAIHDLASQLASAIVSAGVGEYGGDEFGGGQGTLFLYGPNADALFAAIEHALRRSPICSGARVVKRYGRPGDPNAKQVETRP